MTFRSDISVDWNASPRIVEVASPSTLLSIQDLHDTLASLQADILNLDRPKIVESNGKQTLGSGAAVGITLELLDATIGFEARGGPSYTLCTISGGNLVSTDAVGAPQDPINPTAFVTVSYAQSSSATLSTLQLENLQQVVESLRPNHAGYGGLFFWDPLNGDDGNDGTTADSPRKTFASIHDNLVTSGNNDVVFILASDDVVSISERIVISKDNVRLRGPGPSVSFDPVDSAGHTISITGANCELSSVHVSTAHAGGPNDCVNVSAASGAVLLQDVHCGHATGNGISVTGGSSNNINRCVVHECTGSALLMTDVKFTEISNCLLHRNTGTGITVRATAENSTSDLLIHKNTMHHNSSGIDIGYGVRMTIVRSDNYLAPPSTELITDNGNGTHIETIDALATPSLPGVGGGSSALTLYLPPEDNNPWSHDGGKTFTTEKHEDEITDYLIVWLDTPEIAGGDTISSVEYDTNGVALDASSNTNTTTTMTVSGTAGWIDVVVTTAAGKKLWRRFKFLDADQEELIDDYQGAVG